DLWFETRIIARSLGDALGGRGLRLGVTGLSRAGKTVFVTSLVHNLVAGGRLPVLRVVAEGRMGRAILKPQPDDAVPRFSYEEHLAALTGEDRHWPESTRRISELRLTIEFERANGWSSGKSSLTVDIVDYPGEWLLDLPLLGKDYAQFARETVAASAAPGRAALAGQWRDTLAADDPDAEADEERARISARAFADYLRASRADRYALSTLPPGRFLMPGDLDGSPALTFAPLRLKDGAPIRPGSQAALMARRYEAYKAHVVRPFFADHFARLDRQVVLVDALAALNSGPEAVRDLERALGDVLSAFRVGARSSLATLFRPRIDRILFAATKADHLHHTSHDRLEAILRLLAGRAIGRAEGLGAEIDVVALAAVRATREAEVKHGRETLPAIVGVPMAGETVGGETFDGEAEAAIFPGELPADPKRALDGEALALGDGEADWRFVKFRPPVYAKGEFGPVPAPQIRLDRALQFLIGDRLA
ncbi:MAG: YcjX family protein, partial [Hyphomicrobiales bacterium]|nr:YcjX family protein [Hyphomicrobiales bacterium]